VKGGIEAFCRELASQATAYKINVNCLIPGFIGPPEEFGVRDKAGEKINRHIPIKGWGEVTDISGAALFLAADASRYITGQAITIDGGYNVSH
jgi:NAD(P)-dependent dehydrogenase (short-subunit alcohol dehydrogenase family)